MDCPACGSLVTLEVGPDRPLSMSLSDAVLEADEDTADAEFKRATDRCGESVGRPRAEQCGSSADTCKTVSSADVSLHTGCVGLDEVVFCESYNIEAC
jgi:hypothetical protein